MHVLYTVHLGCVSLSRHEYFVADRLFRSQTGTSMPSWDQSRLPTVYRSLSWISVQARRRLHPKTDPEPLDVRLARSRHEILSSSNRIVVEDLSHGRSIRPRRGSLPDLRCKPYICLLCFALHMTIFCLVSDQEVTSADYKASAPILIVAYIVVIVVCMRRSRSSRESTDVYCLTVNIDDLANDIHAPWLFWKNVYEIIDVIFDILNLDTVPRN